RLPPLNALKAFEAAARHEGFIAASDELRVTRGAISRHVKLLEEHLGVALFTRHAKGVRLTAAGRDLQPVLTEMFEKVQTECQRIASDASTLRVICPPATSIRWLVPKLDDFRRKHPDINVRLTTDFFAGEHRETGVQDIGFSVADWPSRRTGFKVQTLFPVYLTPACAPSLLNGRKTLTSAKDLKPYLMLHERPGRWDWTAWIDAFGVEDLDPKSGDEFPNLDMATKAAVMGAGVVMADLVLCREELGAGSLIAPLPHMTCLSPTGGVCLLGREDMWEEPKVRAFRDWAASVAAEDVARLQRDIATMVPHPGSSPGRVR
ncbi:MAG: LysR substrate-binding domain-containing protein, partial [Pseudomonadota bacterium]